MIKCNLQPMYQYTNIARKSKEKFGRYLSSWYPIKGIHKKKWVVGINVDVRDLQEHLDSGTSTEDIAAQCLKYLNTPERGPSGRRRRKPTYGRFGELPVRAYIKQRGDDPPYLQIFATVETRKNKMFWGTGNVK